MGGLPPRGGEKAPQEVRGSEAKRTSFCVCFLIIIIIIIITTPVCMLTGIIEQREEK